MSGDGASSTLPGAGVTSEQSMEDILASIRRILNEDGPPGLPPLTLPTPDRPDTSAAAEEQPLILTEEMMVSAPEAPLAATPDPAGVQALAEAPPPEPAPPSRTAPAAAGGLIAPATEAAATAAVGELLRAVGTDRGAAVWRGGPTLEDVVREELRPILKDWLDQHLPALVERLVRAEIERVIARAPLS